MVAWQIRNSLLSRAVQPWNKLCHRAANSLSVEGGEHSRKRCPRTCLPSEDSCFADPVDPNACKEGPFRPWESMTLGRVAERGKVGLRGLGHVIGDVTGAALTCFVKVENKWTLSKEA